MPSERRFSMIRVSKGFYVLPDNDERRAWAVYAYDENGTLETPEGRVIMGTFWAIALIDAAAVISREADGRLQAFDRRAARDLSWEYGLGLYADGFKTREAALAAIPHGEPPS